MELKKGYKQTDIGILPNDWETPAIEEACELINGRGFKPYEWKDRGLPIIRIQNLNGSDEYNYYLGKYDSKIEVENGQLLFAWSGSRGTSFGPHLWLGSKGLLNYHTWKININEKVIDKRYFLHALKQLTKFIEGQAHGASALVHVQKWEMEKFKFPLPTSNVEQLNIGLALDDMDDLINSLSSLIDKKKAIKQGVMQELLKPKEGWVVKKLGEVVLILDNLRVPLNDNQRSKMSGDIPYCGANGIVDYINDFVIDDDVILMAEDGGYFDEYKTRPIAYRMIGKCWVNNHAHILKANSDTDQSFLYYSLVHKNILDFINGGTRAKLNKGDLVNIEIQVPTDKKTQSTIAQILNDIDNEIQSLEQNLSKYQMLKQGMMQELLTGKTRLV